MERRRLSRGPYVLGFSRREMLRSTAAALGLGGWWGLNGIKFPFFALLFSITLPAFCLRGDNGEPKEGGLTDGGCRAANPGLRDQDGG